jgi:hypothetical protein
MSATASRKQTPEMYLAFEDWSPRFETIFYSFKIESFELRTSLPSASSSSSRSSSVSAGPISVPGKTTLPAYYYKIKVLCGHKSRIVLRRYSQFRWLYDRLPYEVKTGNTTTSDRQGDDDDDDDDTSPPPLPPLSFPPPTWCCQPQNDAFAQNRSEELREFLRDALVRRGAATHDAVGTFLELDALAE